MGEDIPRVLGELGAKGRVHVEHFAPVASGPAATPALPKGAAATKAAAAAADADVTVFDPSYRWTVRASEFASKGRNTPFEGWELPGRILWTLVGGRTAYRAETFEATLR
jgi:dihydroorotase